ncbi:unnamed protein product [Amoebophrya sp. A25]|nr:unnamed protein product [Amoebophrya sp. A25]|eukprot:GSA25T00010631001.1
MIMKGSSDFIMEIENEDEEQQQDLLLVGDTWTDLGVLRSLKEAVRELIAEQAITRQEAFDIVKEASSAARSEIRRIAGSYADHSCHEQVQVGSHAQAGDSRQPHQGDSTRIRGEEMQAQRGSSTTGNKPHLEAPLESYSIGESGAQFRTTEHVMKIPSTSLDTRAGQKLPPFRMHLYVNH